jgi:hypothetical protein
MRKQVSEKTLELNIASELLQLIRGMPGCSRAFWIGLKQDQKARVGIDELIQNVPRGYHLALQFKSPKPTPQNSSPYRFTINDRQNNNFLRLANTRPNAVYYVFPHYNTLQRVRTTAPTLLADTWLLQVYDLRGLAPSRTRSGAHLLESNGGRGTVYSDPHQVVTKKADDLLHMVLSNADSIAEHLLRQDELKFWLKTTLTDEGINRRTIGQLLRGFTTICLS